jgi:hypothetical protein
MPCVPRSLALSLALLAGCGPEPAPAKAVLGQVAWGAEPCASCGMPVAEKPYAAQCLDSEGRVLTYDDLGCLVIEMGSGRIEPRSIQFRHAREDRWIPLAEAGFVRDPATPMAFGFAAVEAAAGTLDFAAVHAELAARHDLPVRWPGADGGG